MKTYKVVPYVASIRPRQTMQAVAEGLETLINDYANQGWQFESVQKIETTITDPGSFGMGAKSANTFSQMVVFSRVG